MFVCSSSGLRQAVISIGIGILLLSNSFQSLAQGTPKSFTRSPSAAYLPIVPYTPSQTTQNSLNNIPVAAKPEASGNDVIDPPLMSFMPILHEVSTSDLQSRWEVKTSDITLYRTLERWSQAAGYKLKWDATKNFLIGAPDTHIGTFESALQSVLSSAGIRLSDYPLEACIYGNTPPLVRITRQGEQARECNPIEFK